MGSNNMEILFSGKHLKFLFCFQLGEYYECIFVTLEVFMNIFSARFSVFSTFWGDRDKEETDGHIDRAREHRTQRDIVTSQRVNKGNHQRNKLSCQSCIEPGPKG